MISDVPGDAVDFSVVRGAEMKRIRLTVVGLDALPGNVGAAFSSFY
jgi:hypothetical protein